MVMHHLLRRESACPVHFIWDGLGLGRWPVRLGFLGFVIAGLIFMVSTLMRIDAPAWMAVAVAGAIWTVGQALSFAAASVTDAR